MSTPRHFQDDHFVVEHAAGDKLLDLVGFSSDGPTRPQKLLLRLERSGWASCYLSAFIAHWDALDDPEVEEVLDTYEDFARIDYCERWPIQGVRIESISCGRADRVTVTITTDTGKLLLREIDGSDPHTDSEFLWYPRDVG